MRVAENNLSAATYAGTTYNYARDYNGEVVRRDDGGGANIVYIGGIYEKNLGTGAVTKYYYADGRRVAMRTGTPRKYIITDNLGSTAVTTNGTTVESRIQYLPFGEIYASEGTIPTDKRFTGQQREYETSYNAIYDYGARMYDAKIGRMLQPQSYHIWNGWLDLPVCKMRSMTTSPPTWPVETWLPGRGLSTAVTFKT